MRISIATTLAVATLVVPFATQTAYAECPGPTKQGMKICNSRGSDLQALQGRGITCYGAGEYSRAIEAFTEALRKGCPLNICMGNRARVKMSMGDLDGALADYAELTEKASSRYVAIVYFKKKDFDRSIVEADRALRFAGDDVEAMYVRGLAKVAKGDATGGLEDQDSAKRMDARAKYPVGDIEQLFKCTHRI